MALRDRWYMHDRNAGRQTAAWRRHRPPERVVQFDPFEPRPRRSPVARKRSLGAGRLPRWLRTGTRMGIGAGMVLVAFGFLLNSQLVAIGHAGARSRLRQVLDDLWVQACN